MDSKNEKFVRDRITELRLSKKVSEHKMSLDLDKSGSYTRGITNGTTLPSMHEFFNICDHFGITPATFFSPLEDVDTPYSQLCNMLRAMSESDLEKVINFIGWLSDIR